MVFHSPVPSPRPYRLSFSYVKDDKHNDYHVFLTLLMSVVGAGMLSVPYTFVLVPTWTALVGIVVVGISMGITAVALLHAHVQLAEDEELTFHVGAGRRYCSFQSIAIAAGGGLFGYVVSIVTAIGIYGGCVGCIRIVRDIAPFLITLARALFTSSAQVSATNEVTTHHAADYVMWASFVLVVFPLCLLKRLSGLRISSYLGFAFSFYLVGAVIYRSHHALNIHDDIPRSPTLANSTTSTNDTTSAPTLTVSETVIIGSVLSRFAQSMSIYNYAFMMHLNLIPLFIQLRGSFAEPMATSQRKMNRCILWIVVFCIVLYAVFGVFAERLYHGTIRGNILLNLEYDPVMEVPLVAVYLTVVLSFPLLFHPLRGVIEELIFTLSIQEISFNTRLITTAVLLLSQLLLAIWVPGIEVVFALTGASSCLMICFVFPAFLFTKLTRWQTWKGGRLMVWTLWFLVGFFTFVSIVASWYLIFDPYRS